MKYRNKYSSTWNKVLHDVVAESGQQAPSARALHESVLINDRTFVWGGWKEEYHSRVDVFSVNMLNGEWHKHTVTPTDAPTPCTDACSAAIGNTIYSFGGRSDRGYRYSDELFKLDLVEMSWKKVGENGIKPERRCGAGMCQVNEKLLLMGGYGPFTKKKHPHAQYKGFNKMVGWNNEFFEFEPHTDCWSALWVTGSQPSSRQNHTLTTVDDKRAVLFGGFDGDMHFNDLWLFDYGKKKWTEIRPSSSLWPQPRSYHTVCTMVCDNQEIKLLLMGGYDRDIETLDDCWLLDVHQGIGEKVMFDGGPFSGRYGHSAHCVKLSDSTVVVSVLGGCDKSQSVFGSPCFYHWNPHNPNMLHYGLAPARTTLHPSHSTDTSKDLQQLREEKSHLIRRTEQQQGQIEQLHAQLAEERCTRSLAEDNVRQLTSTNDQLTREVRKLNEDKQSLQQQVSSAAEETTRQLTQLQRALDTSEKQHRVVEQVRLEKEETQRLMEQMRSEKEQLQQELRGTQQLLRNTNAARGEKSMQVLNKSGEDVTLSDSKLGSGSFEGEADKLVTPEELCSLAEVIESFWDEFALDLAPDIFEVCGNISTIHGDSKYRSPRIKAQAMLETWKNKMHSEATRCVLIQALCKKGRKKQSCDVFGDEVTNTVAP